jgi:hypothetical protein
VFDLDRFIEDCRAAAREDSSHKARDVIHSVTNPLGRRTSASHAYGGDFRFSL